MSTIVPLKIKRLISDAKLPSYQSNGAACFDLHVAGLNEAVELKPGESLSVGTGLAVEIPEGHVLFIFSRSGHGFKNGVRLINGTGIIDSDYRGEIRVGLICDAKGAPLRVANGDRIAQAMLLPMPVVVFEEVAELSETDRGANGFGSTGQ